MENAPRNSDMQGEDLKRNQKKFFQKSGDDRMEASRPWSFADMVKGNKKYDEGIWADWKNEYPNDVMSFGDENSDDEQMEGGKGAITFSMEEKAVMRKP
ncbi:hypothetical protein GOBAR_AA26240 [Gossypium barbadense]|uniref:Uncharacterized protein n=1 Tax=Gossypium barbadense TaxID=3634 RepID=A0A2P5WTN8_GOSBA|nr:hypothetical protein GOBAR_AA26240 [Gossypium barbadense]